jgi:hypothetical protein
MAQKIQNAFWELTRIEKKQTETSAKNWNKKTAEWQMQSPDHFPIVSELREVS